MYEKLNEQIRAAVNRTWDRHILLMKTLGYETDFKNIDFSGGDYWYCGAEGAD